MEALLKYRLEEDEYTLLEILALYCFPADDDISISDIFMDNMSPLITSAAYGEFPAGVCVILISIWDRCFNERFVSVNTLTDAV